MYAKISLSDKLVYRCSQHILHYSSLICHLYNTSEIRRFDEIEHASSYINRIGTLEQELICNDILGLKINRRLRFLLHKNAGLYWNNQNELNYILNLFRKSICSSPSLGVLDRTSSKLLAKVKKNIWYDLEDLNPLLGQLKTNNIFWDHFKAKKICIYSSFSNTIKLRISHGETIIPFLGNQEVSILRSVDTRYYSQAWKEHSWKYYLEKEIEKLLQENANVYLISCGAMSLPVTNLLWRKYKKTAINIGGIHQLLFKIPGKRWSTDPKYDSFNINKWPCPLDSDRPHNYSEIENGCYWT